LSIGVSDDKFWTLNPRKLKPYIKAQELRVKARDEEMWRQGIYFLNALVVGLQTQIHGRKADYYEEPLLVKHEKENKVLSEEEKIAKAEEFFKSLETMQSNFEREQKLKNTQTVKK